MRHTLKRLSAFGCLFVAILTVPVLKLSASGEQESASGRQETGVPSSQPASWSLPTFMIEQADGRAVLRDYDARRSITDALWNPYRSEGQVRIGNRVFSLGDILTSDGTATASGLDIRISGHLQPETSDVSSVRTQVEFTNVSGRPRTFSLRYVFSPNTANESVAGFLPTRLPVTLENLTTSFSSGTSQFIQHEQELFPDAPADAVVAVESNGPDFPDPQLPLTVWPLSESPPTDNPELAQITVSNRDRLLQSPWAFRSGRARDFTAGPGAPPDAAIGMRFHDVTLNAEETVALEFVVYVLHAPAEPPVALTPESDEPIDQTADEESDVDPPDTDGGTQSEPEVTEAAEAEISTNEIRTREAFDELNQALSGLRTLQQREQAPSTEELDEVRLLIEELRRELDNLRRGDSQE